MWAVLLLLGVVASLCSGAAVVADGNATGNYLLGNGVNAQLLTLSYTRNDAWPAPYHTMEDVVRDLKALAPAGSCNITVYSVFTSAVVNVTSNDPAAAPARGLVDRMANRLNSSGFWAAYNLTNAEVGYAPVVVPPWLRRARVTDSLKFDIMGGIGVALMAAEVIYGLVYWQRTRKTLTRRSAKDEEEEE